MRRVSFLIIGIAMVFVYVSVLSHQEKNQRHITLNASPDSQSVVFNAGGEGSNGIYALDLSTMKVQSLMHPQFTVGTPTFSPDGRRIIYAGKSNAAQASHLYTCSLAGKPSRQLTDTAGIYDDMASYSADGRRIVFARALRHRPYSMGGWTWDHWDIYAMQADGTGLRRLTSGQYYQVSPPKFALDGKTILFAADHDDSGTLQTDVFTVKSVGGQAPQPLTGNGHCWNPVFTSDGGHILYVSDVTVPFDYEIWSMDADGEHPTQLTNEHCYLEYPVATGDGKHILALSDKGRSTRYDLYEFDIDGKHPRRIADSGLFDDPLQWKLK